jgi:hypothetical protein
MVPLGRVSGGQLARSPVPANVFPTRARLHERAMNRPANAQPRAISCATPCLQPSAAVNAARQSLLSGLRRGQRFLWLPHELRADEAAIARQRAADLDLLDAVQVADAPIELLERVFGRSPVALGFVVAGLPVSFLGRVACLGP